MKTPKYPTKRVAHKHPNLDQLPKLAGTITGRVPHTVPKPRREPKPMVIHVNQNVIRSNAKHGTNEPPLTVRTGRKGTDVRRAHTVEIDGPSKLVHSPHDRLPCGARIWIETFSPVVVK